MQSYAPAGLSEADAQKVAESLQQRLVSLVDLSLTLKHIHWNLVGPGFIGVHEMLDDHVAATRSMADEVAERIATLGNVPNGLPGFVADRRTWSDYGLGRAVVPAHLAALDRAYEGVVADHRAAIATTDPIDTVTADMLTAQSGKLEMQQWFIRAHLENTSGELPGAEEDSAIDAAADAATTDHLT